MRAHLSSFDPREIPALWEGAVYIPGRGVEPIAGTQSTRWRSLSSDPNDCTDQHTGHKPVLATLPNGAKFWDLAGGGQYSSWLVPAPGPAYQWTDVGAYAAWVYLAANDSAAHIAMAQWPETNQPKNRLYVEKNIDPDRMAVYGSRNGLSQDNALGQDGIGDRWKWNSSWGPGVRPLINWTGWHFLVLQFDMTADNYVGPEETGAGALCSNRLRVFVDGVYFEGLFSTPQPQFGGQPPQGPLIGLAPSDYPFSWGAQYTSNHFDGLGACYVARGPVPLSAWEQIRNFWRPC